jgi:hypothetical protein
MPSVRSGPRVIMPVRGGWLKVSNINIYIHICMYIYIYVCIHIHIHIYIYIHTCIYTYMYIYIYICIYIYGPVPGGWSKVSNVIDIFRNNYFYYCKLLWHLYIVYVHRLLFLIYLFSL